jgi:hypothetical protein
MIGEKSAISDYYAQGIHRKGLFLLILILGMKFLIGQPDCLPTAFLRFMKSIKSVAKNLSPVMNPSPFGSRDESRETV